MAQWKIFSSSFTLLPPLQDSSFISSINFGHNKTVASFNGWDTTLVCQLSNLLSGFYENQNNKIKETLFSFEKRKISCHSCRFTMPSMTKHTTPWLTLNYFNGFLLATNNCFIDIVSSALTWLWQAKKNCLVNIGNSFNCLATKFLITTGALMGFGQAFAPFFSLCTVKFSQPKHPHPVPLLSKPLHFSRLFPSSYQAEEPVFIWSSNKMKWLSNGMKRIVKA